MKTLTINGVDFALHKEGHAFITSYMKRIHSHIHQNNLDENLYEDILLGIEEKLQHISGDITQKNCIDIVNALGEPEDIFEDEVVVSTPIKHHHKKNKHNKTTKQPLNNFFSTTLIIIASAGLATALIANNHPLLFIATLIAIVIFAIKHTQHKKKKADSESRLVRYSGGIRNGLLAAICLASFVSIGERFDGGPEILLMFVGIPLFLSSVVIGLKPTLAHIGNFFTWAGKILLGLSKDLFALCGRGILFVVGLPLFLIPLTLLVFLGLYLSDLTMFNIQYFALVPQSFVVASIAGAVGLGILGVAAWRYTFLKKHISRYWLIGAGVSLTVMLVSGVMVVSGIFSMLSQGEHHTKTYIQEISINNPDKAHAFILEIFHHSEKDPLEFYSIDTSDAEIIAYSGSNVKIESNISRRGPSDAKDMLLTSLFPLSIKINKQQFVTLDGGIREFLNKKTPYMPTSINVKKIFLPKKLKFRYLQVPSNTLPESLQQYNGLIAPSDVCDYYYYDTDKERFTCALKKDLNLDIVIQNKILTPIARQSVSALSPIKHKNADDYSHRYNYRGHRGYHEYSRYASSDREVNKVVRKGDTLDIIYSDGYLRISATAKINPSIQDDANVTYSELTHKNNGTLLPHTLSDFVVTHIEKLRDDESFFDVLRRDYEDVKIIRSYLQ